MPTKQELEKLPTTQLAVMCSKVADDPKHYGEACSKKALELKTKWTSLQSPRESSFKDQKKKETQLLTLHKQIAEFLAGIL